MAVRTAVSKVESTVGSMVQLTAAPMAVQMAKKTVGWKALKMVVLMVDR